MQQTEIHVPRFAPGQPSTTKQARRAPASTRPVRPAVENAAALEYLEDDRWDASRPPPVEESADVDDDDCR